MKKLTMIFVIALMIGCFSCNDEPVEPILEIPVEPLDPTDGDDNEEDGGQAGGGTQ